MSQTLDQMLLLIDGVINAPAEIVAMDRAIAAGSASEASLMLADFAIPYPTADEAQVAMLEGVLSAPPRQQAEHMMTRQTAFDGAEDARREQANDARARDWLASLPAAQG